MLALSKGVAMAMFWGGGLVERSCPDREEEWDGRKMAVGDNSGPWGLGAEPGPRQAQATWATLQQNCHMCRVSGCPPAPSAGGLACHVWGTSLPSGEAPSRSLGHPFPTINGVTDCSPSLLQGLSRASGQASFRMCLEKTEEGSLAYPR